MHAVGDVSDYLASRAMDFQAQCGYGRDRGHAGKQRLERSRSTRRRTDATRRRRSRARHRRRHSSSSRSHSSSSRSSTFRWASNRMGGQESAIARLSEQKPGKLLKQGLQTMFRLAHPSGAVGGASSSGLPASAVQYLHGVVQVTQNQNLSQRDARELRTLATCLDLLAGGRLAEVVDHLMQRFKSVQTTASTRSLELGRHQELIPELSLGIRL